jgi:hypothetical protein
MSKYLQYAFVLLTLASCTKSNNPTPGPEPPPASFSFNTLRVNGSFSGFDYKGINTLPTIKVSFTGAVNQSAVSSAVSLTNDGNVSVPLSVTSENHDSTLVIKPSQALAYLSKYALNISTSLKSKAGGSLLSAVTVNFLTAIDSTAKFAAISDDSLLTLIQRQTFRYFWDFGHPVSGMARERNTSGDVVTTGGSGFGVMATLVAIERKFISHREGFARLQTIVGFLKNKAQRFHGAFSHWMNGNTGVVVPFGPNDDGADIVETSYMMMGLLTARQYFNGSTPEELQLRDDINALYQAIDWTWFQKNGGNVLYWNWSPDAGFAVNVPVTGWNECLITYVMAASSPTHAISKEVYDNGFARNGAMVNNNTFYGYRLPLGPALGGPLFFEQYSFLGINPNGLSDAYANYHEQTVNHSMINFEYCKANPKYYFGYSSQCWGLTASDIHGGYGYNANSPTSDLGVIAPTAAVSSIAYTPEESLQAIKFFYYQLGDKIWGDYGFKDAFSLNDIWFADSYLAIDQGPQIGMIENYRTGLLWRLFMSCPEVQTGLTKLGFTVQK